MKAPKYLVPGTIWKQCARFLILWLQIQAFLKSIEAVVEKDRYKGCGGIFTTSSGTFTSPGYPNSYPDNVVCSYIIQMNPQSRVKINILDLHLEGSGNCDFDSLTIRDGYRDDSPVLKKLCGRQMEQTIISSKSTVLVQLVTDQGVSKRGFKAEWMEIPLIPMLSMQGISFPSPWVGIQSPRGVKQMDSGITSSLWVVTDQNEVLVYSNGAWSTVDGKMRYVTAGDSGVWGIGTDQLIYYRTDVTESNLKGNEWSAVTGNENRKFTKLESGIKGIVTGITDRGEVAFRQGITDENPVGVYWAIMTNPIDGGQRLIDVSCGPYGCWLISSLNNVYFANKITLSNVNSITWKRLDGIRARKITHGFGSSLWAIGVDGYLKRLLGTTILGIDNIYIQNFANIQFVEIANGLQGTYGLTTNGYIARYNDVTCGGLLTEKAGVVTSPNYPYYYPRDVTCLWIIRVNDAKSISFLIQDPFEIDRKPQCLDWIVTFRDGKYPSEFEPIKECGNVKPPMKVIRGNEFWIEFNSTGQVFGKGFQAVYEAGFSDIPLSTTPAPTTTVVITKSVLPEGWKEITVPSPLSSFDTGITQDVWGFNAEGQIYVLMNGQWRKIFEDVVRQVTAGGSGVWAINRNSEIMFRSGISPSNPIGTSWIIVPSNRIFRQIDSGPRKLVATLTFDNNLLLREGISTQSPSGTDWNLLRGNVKSFSLGSYGIWIVDNKNDVYFGKIRQPSKTNGEKSSVEWTLVQGSLLTVSAGLNGQVWGILPSGKLVKRIGINVLQPTGTEWEEVQGMYPRSVTSGVTGTYAQLQDGRITKFNDVKCGGLVTSKSGVIHSPNYPSPYPSSLTCLWIIRVPGMKVINVMFDDFELEDSIACQKDKIVTFKKGFYSPYEEPLMECGTTVKDKVVQGDTFWIEFISDGNINRRGFRFFYNAYSEQITTTIPPQTPVNDCGKILTEPSGVIRSPGYPSTYGNNVDCLYRIQVEPEHRIRLSVVDFSLESHSTCANDWFEIYDGPNDYDLSLGRYCGSSIPSVFTSSSRHLTIKFRSNNDLGRRGFEMTWESIRFPALRTTQSTTPEPLTSPRGEIKDLPAGWVYEPPESAQRFVQVIPSTPGQLFAVEASTNRVLVLSDNRWQPVGTFTARRIAHDGFVLWALDRNGRVYALPDSQQRNQGWQPVGNDVFKSIVAGPFPLVFALKESGDLYVRNGISKSNPFGASWRRIRGGVEDVAVNSYFIWIVEKSGQVQAAPRPISWEFMTPNWRNVDGLSATNVFAGFGPDVWVLNNQGKWYRREGTNAMGYEGVRWTELPLNFKDVAFGVNHIYGVTSSGKIARRQASQCGGLLLSKKGNIISPFFPGNYPHRLNCLWIIKVQDAESISLRFTSFDVESSPNCNKDYLMLYRNGRYSSSNEDKVVLCGRRAQDRQVNSDEVWISFHTDSYNSATGFRILYDSTFPDTDAGSGQTVKATTLAPFYSTTPSPSLLTGCGGFLNGDHGLFASPGYPSKYPNNLKCVYKIAVDPKKSVELVFDDFDIENDNLCRFDFVHLRDGDSEFGRDLGKYCGNVNGGKFKTSGNKMWVFFRADGSVGKRGFKATWRAATSEGDGFPTFQPITPQTVTQAQPVTDSSLPSGWSPFVQEERFSHVDTGTTEAVWALRDSGQPYVQESYYFTPVQGNLFFKHITAGESGIWGISEDNKIYVRVGVAPLAVQGVYWQEVLDSPRLSIIDSGPNRIVVAVDKDNFLYERDGITPSRPQGTRWVMMDRDVKRISVGSYGYWLVDVNGNPYFAPHLGRDRRFRKTPVEGKFRDIQAGFDGSVWAVGPDNSVYRREGISTLSPSGTNWRRIDGLRLIKISSGLTGVFGVTTTGRIVASTDRNCGGILRSRQGRITSPNHPFSYPPRSSCLWIIDVPGANQIRLNFRTFILESSNGCMKDYVLTLRDAKFPSEYEPDKSCGSEVSTKVFRGPKAWIEFVSDGTGNFPGFEAEYVAQTEVPTTEPTTQKITPTTAELIYKYCGGNILGSSGKIAHPSYPNNYLSYRDCTYVITVNRGQRILVQFEKFGLEPDTGCNNDFLEFRDGPNTDGVRLGKFCGSANPSDIRSTGEHLLIRFRTDGSSESEGFLMNWKAEDVEPGVITEKPLPVTTDPSQACGALYTGVNGLITHPGYPSFYKHNQDCVWRIYVTSGFRIQLSFDFFEMQSDQLCQSDFLEIFDGPDQRSPVILKSCGNEVLPAIYTSDNAATIRFVSDSQRTAAGFRLNWQRAPHPSTKEPEGPVTQRPACVYSENGIGGAIYHSNYPERYRPNQDCIWTITVAPDKVVRLSIDLFELEEHFPCSKDFVAIHDGPSIQSPKKLTLCGKRSAQAFQSSSNRLTLRFVSDDDKEDLGFYIRWFAANKQTTLPTEAPTTKLTTTETEKTTTIKFERTTEISSTEAATIATQPIFTPRPSSFFDICFGDTSGTSGIIVTPNYPRRYPARLDCSMTIRSPAGTQIVMVFKMFALERSYQCRYDSLAIKYGERTSNAPTRKYCSDKNPGTLTAPGNVVYLRLTTDSSGSLAGFKIEWRAVPATGSLTHTTDTPVSVLPTGAPKCGWRLYGQSGTIRNPRFQQSNTYGVTCIYVIEVGSTSVINLDFQYFDLGLTNCASSYLLVRDAMSSDGRLLGKFCEGNIPTTLRSTGNFLWIEYKANQQQTGDTFVMNWRAETLTKRRGFNCGGVLAGNNGVISSPSFPDFYPHNVLCNWLIKAPRNSKVILRFTFFDIEDSSDCQADYVKVIDGDSSTSRVIKKSCGKRNPGIITSTGNSLWIEMKSDCKVSKNGFRALWRLTRPVPTEGPDSENNGGLEGPKIITTKIPGVVTTKKPEETTIRPIVPSSEVNTDGGLILGLRGIIRSPNYPSQYPPNSFITWILRGPPNGRIRLTFHSFELEDESGCRYDYVQIRDGPSADSEEAGRFCGSRLPATYISGSNSLWVRFKSDASLDKVGFEASWQWISEYSAFQPARSASSQTECGGFFKQTMGLIRSPGYPKPYPSDQDCIWVIKPRYASRIQLRFSIFEVEDSRSCISDFVEIRSGDSPSGARLARLCGRKRGLNFFSDQGSFWIHFKTDSFRSGIGFEAEWITTGFVEVSSRTRRDIKDADFLSCGQTFNQQSGHLTIPSKTGRRNVPLHCRWVINVPLGREIYIQIHELVFADTGGCDENYFEVRVPYKRKTALLVKYCKDERKIGTIVRSKEKYVEILYRNNERPSEKQFHVTWITYRTKPLVPALSKEFTLFGAHTGCSRTLESSSGSFQSPNYPRNYPVNTACVWVITIKDKTKTIKLTFDAFNLEEHEKCRYDYLLVRDGDSPLSPVIGKYCGTSLPSHIRSTGNKLWITFYSDSVFTASGFRASYISDELPKTRLASPTSITTDKEKLAVCGGILSGKNGEITSPNYPGKYPRNTICRWKITNKDPTVSIKIEFLDFKLEHGYLCQHDYVLIRDEYSDSKTIGKYCGRETPQPIYAQSMEIEFKSDRTHNRRGFMAIWRKVPKPTSHTSQVETRKPSQPGCGGYQSGFVGSIRSKGYPDNYQNHQHCEWVLVSEPYTKLQLRFSNFDLEYSRGCLYDYVEVHDGVNNNSPLLGKYCGQEIPQLISASSNALYVVFHSDDSDTRGGFEGTWVADITQAGENNFLSENQPRMALDVSGSCGGIQRGSQGTIRSPNFPRKYPKLSNCVWDIEGSQDKNIELRFKSMDVEYHRQCKYDRIIVRDGVSSSDAVLGRLCGRSLHKPIRSNGRQMRVRFFSDSTSEGNGFELQWKLVERKDEKRRCGGLLNGERGTVVSPDYGKSPGRRYICTWRITVPINKKIKITFKDLDIRAHPSCGFGYVQIHDGGDSRSNEIGLFCGSFTPKAITTSTNKVLIGYLSDGSRRTRGFNLEWESTIGGDTVVPTQVPSKDATPCDSVLREESGIITMNKGVKNCTWIIKISNGKRVSLSFLNTDLISGPDCREEYLEVREGLTTSAPVLLRLCGNVKPGQLTSFVGVLRISYVIVKPSRDHTSQLKLAWNVAASSKAANGINDESCGIKKSKVNTKFVDGRGKATLGSLPWVVGLTSGIGRAYCGASLLTTTWIITAAHCFERFPIPSFWQVVLGETDLSAINQNGKRNSIQNIFLHPSYDPVTRENDIALVQLDSQTTLDDRVTTICLADISDNVLPGTVCSTAGWGTRSFLGKPSIPLIHVRPPMVSRSTCNSTRAYNGRITSTMICAGRDEGGIDSCQGDGGGPLTCEDVNGKSKLYGISSWGNGCAFPFKYGVYTDVRKYIQWISTIIQS